MSVSHQIVASNWTSRKSLEIKTKSIEQTLVPLVNQIATLVNFKERSIKPAYSDRVTSALVRVGEAVHSAIERFVSVGESIASENPDIQANMHEACNEARSAGIAISKLTSGEKCNDKKSIVQAARGLLSAVTKVLLLADVVIVRQIISAKKKVTSSLNALESVSVFPEFTEKFSQYGSDMVALARFTGERQNDLKDERRKAQLSSVRTILEKSTMLILTSSKNLLRHPDSHEAKKVRDITFAQVRKALDMAQLIVLDSGPMGTSSSAFCVLLDKDILNFVKASKQFEYELEMQRISSTNVTKEKLLNLCNSLIENSQDFTDSTYVSHEQRERILSFHVRLRDGVEKLVHIDSGAPKTDFKTSEYKLEAASSLQSTICEFRSQLENLALFQATEFFRTNDEVTVLNEMKNYSVSGKKDLLEVVLDKFKEQSELACELSKLLRHVAPCDQLQVSCEHYETLFYNLSAMIIISANCMVKLKPPSKTSIEHFDVLIQYWIDQINSFSVLVKELQDVIECRTEKLVYFSLPRPGRHGTTVRAAASRGSRLDADERAKIAKLGLEMKLITSEVDAETERWEGPQNEIIKRAKNMSSMAFSMYLFTRNEGSLKTPQDLFTQAYYFVEEGLRLHSVIEEIAVMVPPGPHRHELVSQLEALPLLCNQLRLRIRITARGKNSIFAKVDAVMQDTRDIMNSVAKLVTTCFLCFNRYNLAMNPLKNARNQNVKSALSRDRDPLCRMYPFDRPYDSNDETASTCKSMYADGSSSLQRSVPLNYLPAFDRI